MSTRRGHDWANDPHTCYFREPEYPTEPYMEGVLNENPYSDGGLGWLKVYTPTQFDVAESVMVITAVQVEHSPDDPPDEFRVKLKVKHYRSLGEVTPQQFVVEDTQDFIETIPW